MRTLVVMAMALVVTSCRGEPSSKAADANDATVGDMTYICETSWTKDETVVFPSFALFPGMSGDGGISTSAETNREIGYGGWQEGDRFILQITDVQSQVPVEQRKNPFVRTAFELGQKTAELSYVYDMKESVKIVCTL